MADTAQLPEDDDTSFLELSDDEVLAMGIPQPIDTATGEDLDPNKAPEADPAKAPDEPAGEDGDAGAGEDEGEDDDNSGDPQDAPADNAPAADAKTPVDAQGKSGEEDPVPKPEDQPQATDYEAEYKKLLAPFKANGKEMQVTSTEDAIALMQMGANYNKKMAALKPNLKLLKLLENNGLLNEEKLSFLIDLDKKNPDAISKLVKDSGIDPLDMDVNKSEYKPKTYTVDDREVELDLVLEKLQDSPGYNETIQIVSNKWDGPSKQVVAQHPQLLEVINDHVTRGIYGRISAEVERERMFGRLSGLSDIEAYRTVGDAMQARGAFNDLAPAKATPPADQRRPITPKPKAEDPEVRARKLAASSPKAAVPASQTDSDFNPLSLSDDEFSKIGNPRLM